MRRNWLTLIIIIAGGFYFWLGDETPPKSTDNQRSPEVLNSPHPYHQPAYPSTVPRSQQGWNAGNRPSDGYWDDQRPSNHPVQAEYQYGQARNTHPPEYQYGKPQTGLPQTPNRYGQTQGASYPSGYPYGQSQDRIQAGSGYQYGQAQNQPPSLSSYPGQPQVSYPQDPSFGQSSFYRGNQDYRYQPDFPQANMGWQQPSYTARPAANGYYSEERSNPTHQGHGPQPGNLGYTFRPLEKKKSGRKRWTGNYRHAPRTRLYSPPPARSPHTPDRYYPTPWQQPDQVYNNNSLWAGTEYPLRHR